MYTVRAIYVWVSGLDTHHDIRSKERTLNLVDEPTYAADSLLRQGVFPPWNFDGSSTAQAKGPDTEIRLEPVRALRLVPPTPQEAWHTPRYVVLCECLTPDRNPTADNSRRAAVAVFDSDEVSPTHPWFGLEQEFVLYKDGRPLYWPSEGLPPPQGPYYCSTGPMAWGRDIVDEFYDWGLKIGLKISGTNAEVTPSQWEFQVGPCEGIEAGDHLILARWLLLRVLERRGPQYDVSFDAKPILGDWNGSGMHANFSTADMRKAEGITHIHAAIATMAKNHEEDLKFYGADNRRRLSGRHETSSLTKFSFGVGTRNTSIRIPNAVRDDGYGYLEDRRPSASADPYLVTSKLVASALGLPAPSLKPFARDLL